MYNKEYYQKNRLRIIQQQKKYYQKNKKRILVWTRQWQIKKGILNGRGSGNYIRTFKTKIKMSLANKGENNPSWKGGKTIDKRGYILIYSPKGYLREHRFVIEKQIGRYLTKKEVAHHINKIKDDNRPQNLMAFKNHSIHRKFEWGKEIEPIDIIFDGRLLNIK